MVFYNIIFEIIAKFLYVGYGFKTSVIFVGEGWQEALDNNRGTAEHDPSLFNIGEGWQGALDNNKGAAKHDSSLFNIGEGWQGAAEDDRGAADMIQVCLI